MCAFLQLLVAASLALLSWWRFDDLKADEIVSIALLGLSGLAVLFVSKARRSGFWLALLLGLGHLAGILDRVAVENLHLVMPMVIWCILTIGGSALLLVVSRKRGERRGGYERHPEF